MNMEVKGHGRRGRPKLKWKDKLKDDNARKRLERRADDRQSKMEKADEEQRSHNIKIGRGKRTRIRTRKKDKRTRRTKTKKREQ